MEVVVAVQQAEQQPREPDGDDAAGRHADEDALAVVGDDVVRLDGERRADDDEEHDVYERLAVRREVLVTRPASVGRQPHARLAQDQPLDIDDDLYAPREHEHQQLVDALQVADALRTEDDHQLNEQDGEAHRLANADAEAPDGARRFRRRRHEGEKHQIAEQQSEQQQLTEPHGAPVVDERTADHLRHQVDLEDDDEEHAETRQDDEHDGPRPGSDLVRRRRPSLGGRRRRRRRRGDGGGGLRPAAALDARSRAGGRDRRVDPRSRPVVLVHLARRQCHPDTTVLVCANLHAARQM